ncbi:hypothetical protein BJ878DRAFT_490869 [Calycina marina]|uniref:Uncharacterized protein n=1 Tax=Calycina marina TaxID=1763456 RepID=A0A9P7Z982_9HELO|nr:hypothetical protein BJ878DRAFT_490869 [Calycina marina]
MADSTAQTANPAEDTPSNAQVAPMDTKPTPFPTLDGPLPSSPNGPHEPASGDAIWTRENSNTSSFQARLRSASESFKQSAPPSGFSVATAQMVNDLPTITDIRRGSYNSDGWSAEGQAVERERKASVSRVMQNDDSSQQKGNVQHQSIPEATDTSQHNTVNGSSTGSTPEDKIESMNNGESCTNSPIIMTDKRPNPDLRTTPFENGYQFPPKHSWGKATKIFLLAFWKFFITPIGFLVVIYGLNVVAWGGMLFLLLCNASPAMCKPNCNDINSPRRVWIEIDSQILNALFCVTGFGTVPWRFRDLYYLLQYRIQKKEIGIRRLAGINRGWLRLPGSQELPAHLGPSNVENELATISEKCLAFPLGKQADAPLTGIRAPATKLWKLDFVVWAMVWNTFLQALLCAFMWGFNRYKRPSWSTGLFVAMACIVAMAGGIMTVVEGQHVKKIEGVPVSEEDLERLRKDQELGVTHWNNINDEKPKDPKEKDKSHDIFKRKKNTTEEMAGEPVEVDHGVRE